MFLQTSPADEGFSFHRLSFWRLRTPKSKILAFFHMILSHLSSDLLFSSNMVNILLNA